MIDLLLESRKVKIPNPDRDRNYEGISYQMNGQPAKMIIWDEYAHLADIIQTLDITSADALQVSVGGFEELTCSGRKIYKMNVPGIDFPVIIKQVSDNLRDNGRRETPNDNRRMGLEYDVDFEEDDYSPDVVDLVRANMAVTNRAKISGIHEFTVGRDLQKKYFEHFGKKLEMEESICMITLPNGDRYTMFNFCDKDIVEPSLQWRREFNLKMERRLFEIGYVCIDLQFLHYRKENGEMGHFILDFQYLHPFLNTLEEGQVLPEELVGYC
jgi:hypothetical protein